MSISGHTHPTHRLRSRGRRKRVWYMRAMTGVSLLVFIVHVHILSNIVSMRCFPLIDKFSQIICGYIHVHTKFLLYSIQIYMCLCVFQVTSENTIYVESRQRCIYIHIARCQVVVKFYRDLYFGYSPP